MNSRILLALAVNAILVKAADKAEDTSMVGEIITSLGLESLVSEVPEVASVLADSALLSSLIDEIEPWELSSVEAVIEANSGTNIYQELSSIIEGLNTVGVIVETFPSSGGMSGSMTSTGSAGSESGSGRKTTSVPSRTTSGSGSMESSGSGSNTMSALSGSGSKALSGSGSKALSAGSSGASSSSSKSKAIGAENAAPVAAVMGALGLALL